MKLSKGFVLKVSDDRLMLKSDFSLSRKPIFEFFFRFFNRTMFMKFSRVSLPKNSKQGVNIPRNYKLMLKSKYKTLVNTISILISKVRPTIVLLRIRYVKFLWLLRENYIQYTKLDWWQQRSWQIQLVPLTTSAPSYWKVQKLENQCVIYCSKIKFYEFN